MMKDIFKLNLTGHDTKPDINISLRADIPKIIVRSIGCIIIYQGIKRLIKHAKS